VITRTGRVDAEPMRPDRTDRSNGSNRPEAHDAIGADPLDGRPAADPRPAPSRRRSAPPAPLVGVVALLLLLAAACGTTTSTGSGAEATGPLGTDKLAVPEVRDGAAPVLPVTVDSADGRSVTVTDTSRIVVLQGNIAEVVFALGLGDRVVGRDISATFDEAADVPLVTRAHDVSAESVLSLRPTVVLADTDTGPSEAIDHIRNVGVPLVVFDTATRIDQIGPRIEAVAAALGVAPTGEALAADTEQALADVTHDLDVDDRPSVAFLYLRGQAGVYLMGGNGSGADSMIEAAGGTDAGTTIGLDKAFTPITSEALVLAAPDVILMTTTGLESVGGIDGLVQIPGIGQTPAGQNRRVVTVEDGLLYSFGVRTPVALAQLAAELHAAPAAPTP
jgi:iron complex transport system substrate-binding protein